MAKIVNKTKVRGVHQIPIASGVGIEAAVAVSI